jgi:polyhydroxybutyrate depolymerase
VLEIHGTADQVLPYGARRSEYKASVRRWLGQWRRLDGCHGNVDRLKLAPGVTEIAWRHCAAGTRVEHVRLDRRAHGWPRRAGTQSQPAPYAATWRAWEFFRSLLPRPPVQTG